MADPERPYKHVGHTCPDIDRIKRMIRKYVPEPEKTKGLAIMEELREDNVQLRANALHHVQGTAPGS